MPSDLKSTGQEVQRLCLKLKKVLLAMYTELQGQIVVGHRY